MGVEAQNTLHALADLGLIDRSRNETKRLLTYTLEYLETNDFIPTLKALKYLETMCDPYKMKIDARNKKVILEYII